MMFVLAKFDMRQGNQIVWTSEHVDCTSLPGIEFKMIPSGLHDRATDTIYFVCGSYHGIACYEAHVSGPSGSREGVRMYSLAAVVPNTEQLPWNQEAFLRTDLGRYMDHDDDPQWLPVRQTSKQDLRDHPLLSTVPLLRVYGATIFELWKAGLSRMRVILSPVPGQTIKTMCQFAYIATQISAVPDDVADLLPVQKGKVRCHYNVGIGDLQRLQSAESFWATTTDHLLLSPSRDACDVYVEPTRLQDISLGSPPRSIYPSWRDRYRFRLLIECLKLQQEIPHIDHSPMETVVDATSSGLIWWASAGESTVLEREENAMLLNSSVPTQPVVPLFDSANAVGIALLGQFQQYTRQLIRVFARMAQDDESVIRIALSDIAAMGLDPLARSDRDFLQRFALAWWDRPLVVHGGCLCCFR